MQEVGEGLECGEQGHRVIAWHGSVARGSHLFEDPGYVRRSLLLLAVCQATFGLAGLQASTIEG